MRDRYKILMAQMSYFKYPVIAIVFVLAFCSCDMGRFYARQRLGGTHVKPSAPERVVNTRADTFHNKTFIEEEMHGFEDHPIDMMDEGSQRPQPFVHFESNKTAVTPCQPDTVNPKPQHINHSVMADTETSDTNKKESFGLILLLALMTGIEIGVFAFLVSWIFKSASAALIIGLWAMAIMFVFVLLMGIYFKFIMGDRAHPPGSP